MRPKLCKYSQLPDFTRSVKHVLSVPWENLFIFPSASATCRKRDTDKAKERKRGRKERERGHRHDLSHHLSIYLLSAVPVPLIISPFPRPLYLIYRFGSLARRETQIHTLLSLSLYVTNHMRSQRWAASVARAPCYLFIQCSRGGKSKLSSRARKVLVGLSRLAEKFGKKFKQNARMCGRKKHWAVTALVSSLNSYIYIYIYIDLE